MPLTEQAWSRVSRIIVLALLALSLTGPAVLLGDRTGAAAGWQLVPSGSSPLVRITSNHVTTGLYPGVSKELILRLQNSDHKHGIVVRRVRVRDIATTNSGCAPTRRNLAIRQYKGAPVRIPPGQTRTVSAFLSMPSTVSDACQRVTFKLRYTARARFEVSK
jgi:hypothetical protein